MQINSASIKYRCATPLIKCLKSSIFQNTFVSPSILKIWKKFRRTFWRFGYWRWWFHSHWGHTMFVEQEIRSYTFGYLHIRWIWGIFLHWDIQLFFLQKNFNFSKFWPKSDRILKNVLWLDDFCKLIKCCFYSGEKRFFVLEVEYVTFFFKSPPLFLPIFAKHSKWHKIITRGRKDIPKPDFESSWRVLSRYEFIDAKFYVFDAFL